MDEEDLKNPDIVKSNPALEAINHLIESSSAKERAGQCKLDGNQFFEVAQKEKANKKKRDENMELALNAYKRAGKFCNDAIKELGHKGSLELAELMQLKSTCHTNSAVVHMAQGNLQAAVSECKVAIRVFSGNMKVGCCCCFRSLLLLLLLLVLLLPLLRRCGARSTVCVSGAISDAAEAIT